MSVEHFLPGWSNELLTCQGAINGGTVQNLHPQHLDATIGEPGSLANQSVT